MCSLAIAVANMCCPHRCMSEVPVRVGVVAASGHTRRHATKWLARFPCFRLQKSKVPTPMTTPPSLVLELVDPLALLHQLIELIACGDEIGPIRLHDDALIFDIIWILVGVQYLVDGLVPARLLHDRGLLHGSHALSHTQCCISCACSREAAKALTSPLSEHSFTGSKVEGSTCSPASCFRRTSPYMLAGGLSLLDMSCGRSTS